MLTTLNFCSQFGSRTSRRCALSINVSNKKFCPGQVLPPIVHLRHCASSISDTQKRGEVESHAKDKIDPPRPGQPARAKIDKRVLTISERKRIRSKEHLPFKA